MKRSGKKKAVYEAGAIQLAKLVSPAQLHPVALAWAANRRKADFWTVALSGGSDSVALLLLLWAHWPARRSRLVALHFNHRLRGRESTADEKFCRQLCAGLGISLKVGRWLGVHSGASEAEARAARHLFFAQEMNRIRSRVLWLAHQQDDIAETMFMRLARGSGLGGLVSPRPVHTLKDRRTHLRPLLTLKKAELVAVLRQAGIRWREDSSNAAGFHFRNRIRNAVIPLWIKSAERDALAGAALSRELLEEDDQALEAWAERVISEGPAKKLNTKIFTGLPRAVARRVLHRWLLETLPTADLSRQGFELLLAAVERGKPTRFSLGRHVFAVISEGQLYRKRT